MFAELTTREPLGFPPGTLTLLVLCFIASLLVPIRASAQTKPPAVPAVLTSITVNDEDGATTVLLTFTPLVPSFSIINNNTDRPAIGFALSSRATSAAIPSGLSGRVRSMTFEQQDTVMILRMVTAGAVRAEVEPLDSHIISIKLSGGSVAGPTTGQYEEARSGVLPQSIRRAPGEDAFEVVHLKYADVSEIVGLLTSGITIKSNDSFTPNEPDFGSAGLGGSSNYVPVQPPTTEELNEPLGESVDESIGVDRRLNAIILRGSPALIARMKREIAAIDVPVRSVVLETIFVELNEQGARNVGLDFNNNSGQIGVATFQAGAFIPAGLPTDQTLTSGALQASIYAEVRNGHGRIVSKPRIAAQSGSTAKIITGDALPILTAIALSGVNGVSEQVQYVNVGVTLQIAPRVSTDGFVTSHIFCVVSSVTGFSQGYPTISQRKAETAVTVKDGETFVIGGLTEENEIRTNSHVPILGRVPVLGSLFSVDKGTKSKTELYIVVTSRIVGGRFEETSTRPAVE